MAQDDLHIRKVHGILVQHPKDLNIAHCYVKVNILSVLLLLLAHHYLCPNTELWQIPVFCAIFWLTAFLSVYC